MKTAIFTTIKARAMVHKWLACLALLVLISVLGSGAYFGWQKYQYMQTADYALQKLKETLNPPQTTKLAALVDFNTIGNEVAAATRQNFPFFKAGPDQERAIRNIVQNALLQNFMVKDPKPILIPEDEKEEDTLKRDLQLLPPDFLAQVIRSMTLKNTGPDSAIITAQVANPLLKQTFTLVFNFIKTPQGWTVKHLANAEEAVSQLRGALLTRFNRLREVYEQKNAATRKQMNQMLPILSCSVDAGLLSDRKTLLMVLHVIARNQGSIQINNFDLDATIRGRSGKAIMQRFLNAAKPVAPGEDFNHRWNFELDGASPLGREILGSGPLQCQAQWQTLGINAPQVLHIQEVPHPDEACDIPGHNHPANFCILPIFQ